MVAGISSSYCQQYAELVNIQYNKIIWNESIYHLLTIIIFIVVIICFE